MMNEASKVSKFIGKFCIEIGKYCFISVIIYFIGAFFEKEQIIEKVLPYQLRQIKDYKPNEKLWFAIQENDFIKQSSTVYYNKKYDVKISIEKELPLQSTTKELCLENKFWCSQEDRLADVRYFAGDFNVRNLWKKYYHTMRNLNHIVMECMAEMKEGGWI